jgi:predicted DCC family thiol-disulfide oxidoreductase YuxK
MARSEPQGPDGGTGQHLFLYDGECGLCSSLVQAILVRDRRAIFHFAALQSDVARITLQRFGSTPDSPDTSYVVVNYRGARRALLSKGRAALFTMATLGWPWSAAWLLTVLPDTVLDALYDVVARNRHRLFGRARCQLTRPEHRARFIDSLQDGASLSKSGVL